MNYVSVDVECPCGYLLTVVRSDLDSNGIRSGRKTCPACRKTVVYQVRAGHAHAAYERH